MPDEEEDKTPVEQFVSHVDPLFADVWNAFNDPQEDPPATEGDPAADPPADGNETPALTDEGTGGTAPPEPAPGEGAEPEPPPPGQLPPPVVPVSGGPGRSYAEVVPQFAEASRAIEERANNSFKTQATQELSEQMGPLWAEALKKHPRMLVGTEVPSLKKEGMELIRDSADAAEWQEAAKQTIEAEVASRVADKQLSVKPMMSVLQESVLLFQNNQDLVPNTKEFDKELADRFTDFAESYELRINGKLYGYEGNVQPLINKIRTQLATERGATGVKSQQRQEQAAAQSRAEDGKFDAPQAGIPVKSGSSGEAGENMDDFWRGVGIKI